MHIVADENIPYVQDAFGTLGTVRLMAGRSMQPADVRDADVLLVRSVTPVDAALLADSRVRFVGSATIGTDHVDREYLAAHGIGFAHAPGSNADSVVEYVLAALLELAVRMNETLIGQTVGLVGCGNIGGRLARRLPALGLRVLKNDPPLAEAAERAGQSHDYLPLETLLAQADILTCHVPLTHEGLHATHHLIGAGPLQRAKSNAWLLNTSRGPVVANVPLREALKANRLGAAVLDVWEGEPTPDPELVRQVDLATPHIAGYSFDGKVAGTAMLYEAVTDYFGLAPRWDAEVVLAPSPDDDDVQLAPPAVAGPQERWLHDLVRQMYDISADDGRLRKGLGGARIDWGAHFAALRKHYPRRRAFDRHTLPADAVPDAYRRAVEESLRVRLV
jgi:erythronate-4-phosphate dehydrogenase